MSRVRVHNLSISLDGFDTRPAIEMEGGTTCHFIDASPAEALERSREAAYGKGGGTRCLR